MLTQVYYKKPKGKILRKLRKENINIKTTVWIGKNGLSEELIKQIRNQVNKNNIVKIRVLKNALGGIDRKEYIKEVAKELIKRGLYVIDIRGYTILVAKSLE